MKIKTIFLDLGARPFEAIKNRAKRIEIRANKNMKTGNAVNLLKSGDIIIFQKENSNEKLKCIVKRITLYKSVRDLLTAEGTRYALSSTNDIEEGIKSVEAIDNYKETIRRNGVFAIKLGGVKTMPIRKFRKEDAARCSEIAFQGIDDDELLSEDAKRHIKSQETPERFRGKSRRRDIFVYEENGEICGVAGLEGREIKSVFVARDKREKGIGSELVLFLEGEAEKRGKHKVFLEAAVSAEGFYGKLGYRKLRAEHNKRGNFDVIVMEKAI